jgi:23S rRNA (pseudouridine1915-N3)-methyltransferase
MRLIVAAIGRARDAGFKALWASYAVRLQPPVELAEIEIRARGPELVARENAALRAAVERCGRVVALDPRGRALDSPGFARQLAAWADGGAAAAGFVIGGADGLESRTLERADLVLSLGAMIWPHQLARIMLIEQLYRAQTIRAGHPYHRG